MITPRADLSLDGLGFEIGGCVSTNSCARSMGSLTDIEGSGQTLGPQSEELVARPLQVRFHGLSHLLQHAIAGQMPVAVVVKRLNSSMSSMHNN